MKTLIKMLEDPQAYDVQFIDFVKRDKHEEDVEDFHFDIAPRMNELMSKYEGKLLINLDNKGFLG